MGLNCTETAVDPHQIFIRCDFAIILPDSFSFYKFGLWLFWIVCYVGVCGCVKEYVLTEI